ncbi:MAG: ATP-dependent helicase, partial [Fidelibacterota bacterium]
ENIVVLTFTERATRELLVRIKNELQRNAHGMVISTFHAFCNQLVREYSKSPLAEKLLLQESDITFLLLDRFDELTFLASSQFRTNPARAVTRSFIPFFNRIRDELLTPEDLTNKLAGMDLSVESLPDHFPGLSNRTDPDEYIRQFDDLVRVYETYQSWKSELGVVDYADMILDCWEMLNRHSNILHRIRKRFRHVIIDEFQDNNYALNRVIGLMAGKTSSLTVVGDEDQCIYTFRGANYYNIKEFRNRYGVSPGAGEVILDENHRSTQEILDLANASITHDRNRTVKELRSARGLHGSRPVWHVGDGAQTLEAIPRLVSNLVTPASNRRTQGSGSYGDIAILCRTWNQVKTVGKALERAFIPVDIFVERFFSIPAIKDVLAWGEIVCNTRKSDSALFRVLVQLVGHPFAGAVFRESKSRTLRDRLQQLEKLTSGNGGTGVRKDRLRWILDTVEQLERKVHQKRPADEMIWEILKATDLLKEARRSYRYAQRLALTNVGHLLSLAEMFAAREQEKTLDRWLKYMDVLALDASLPAFQPEFHDSSAAVQVMTIHKSKGLEFPIVMIPFLRSGSFPLNYVPVSQIDSLPEGWYHWPKPPETTPRDEHVNEERRIFYVAVTRAREQVHLFGPEKAGSLFVREILSESGEYVERTDMSRGEPLPQEGGRSGVKQKLLVELNRELSAHHYDNAHHLINGLRSLELEGKLPEDNPYAYLTKETNVPPVGSLGRWKTVKDVTEPAAGRPVPSEVTLSASRVEEYDTCPYKYRLSKVDRVPERKSRAEMEFGIIIHNVLDEFHGSEDQSVESLLLLLEKHWRREAFEYLIREQEFRRQGERILKDYFDYIQAHPPLVAAREATFDFKIKKLNVRITGKIDRIDRDGDSLTVTDYKTGKNRQKAKQSLQLALYSEALRRNAVQGIEGTPGSARLHFLRNPSNPLESCTFSPADLEKHLHRVNRVAEGIRRRKFDPKPGWHCDNCDYRDFLCPAWEET